MTGAGGHLVAPLAHGFGIRYDLPVPLAYYMAAGAAVVALSFVLVAVFVRGQEGDEFTYPRIVFPPQSRIGRVVNSPVPRIITGSIGVLVLLAIIVTGFFGAPDATDNPADYLLWVYFWAALVPLSALVGNLYALFSPFTAIYDAFRRLVPREEPPLRYPGRLGRWPAVAGYFCFAWFELASHQSANPRAVATAATVYTVYTLVMLTLFGRDKWLDNGEVFAVLFSFVGAFAPIAVRTTPQGRELELRPWGVGLLRLTRDGWDTTMFIILLLSSLAFDGIEATPAWAQLTSIAGAMTDALGDAGPIILFTLGLAATAAVFLIVYLVFLAVVQQLGQGRGSFMRSASFLAYTLVPIALVYQTAHFYSYIVIQGQGLIPLLADPLHTGAHLLPTAGYKVSFVLAGAAFVWLLQVVLIVLGHILAVYLAHRRALSLYRPPSLALLSQYPMVVLMVGYTATSLWILAQPIAAG